MPDPIFNPQDLYQQPNQMAQWQDQGIHPADPQNHDIYFEPRVTPEDPADTGLDRDYVNNKIKSRYGMMNDPAIRNAQDLSSFRAAVDNYLRKNEPENQSLSASKAWHDIGVEYARNNLLPAQAKKELQEIQQRKQDFKKIQYSAALKKAQIQTEQGLGLMQTPQDATTERLKAKKAEADFEREQQNQRANALWNQDPASYIRLVDETGTLHTYPKTAIPKDSTDKTKYDETALAAKGLQIYRASNEPSQQEQPVQSQPAAQNQPQGRKMVSPDGKTHKLFSNPADIQAALGMGWKPE